VASRPAVSPRQLPLAPEFARPVTVVEPRAGEPILVIAARERAGRQWANTVITNMVDWYEAVRRSYEETPP
jgi:hypothetical protein